jgi:hypothetical protein
VAVLSAVHDQTHANTDSIIGVGRLDLGEVSHQETARKEMERRV